MNTPLDSESVARRLSELAPQSDDIAALIQNDEAAWTLAFENDVAILVQWAGEIEHVVLSADIGKAPRERAAQVHAAALSYNTLWRETGGARICMGGEGGELLLVRELDAEKVQGGDFPGILEHFAGIAQWWERHVTSEDFGSNTPMPGMAELSVRV